MFLLGIKAYLNSVENEDLDIIDHLFYTEILVGIRTIRFILQILSKITMVLTRVFRKKRYRGKIEHKEELI